MVLACVAVAALAVAGGQGLAKVGSEAPDFSAKGTDGKTHTLNSLSQKGDVFLYFISETCPVNADAVKYYNRLSAAYKGKATFVGVINGDEKVYKAWQKTYKSPFTVLYDPDLKIIRSYKANASPWMIQVSKTGKIAKVWPGYSTPALKEINAALAKAGGTKVAKVDLKGAPADMAFG
jgi:peroxiredoxin